MSKTFADVVESMQTKDRLLLSVFVSLRKMLEAKKYAEAEEAVQDLIDVQKQNLQEGTK